MNLPPWNVPRFNHLLLLHLKCVISAEFSNSTLVCVHRLFHCSVAMRPELIWVQVQLDKGCFKMSATDCCTCHSHKPVQSRLVRLRLSVVSCVNVSSVFLSFELVHIRVIYSKTWSTYVAHTWKIKLCVSRVLKIKENIHLFNDSLQRAAISKYTSLTFS